MANTIATQTLLDGPKNAVFKIDVRLDTSDISPAQDIIIPANLSGAPTSVSVEEIQFDVEDVLVLNLTWDATAAVPLWRLAGRGHVHAEKWGGIPNNAGAGKTGHIQMGSQGWSAGAVLTASFIIACAKNYS